MDVVEARGRDVFPELSGRVLGCAMEVHRHLGPGLLESVYRQCLGREITRSGLSAEAEVPIPVAYKGETLDCGFRADLVVEGKLLVELKAVERLLPIHEAQLLTYLKLSRVRLGLLINFNAAPLKNGIRRFVR